MKRLAAVLTLTGAIFGIAIPATTALAAGPQVCVQGDINVNGTDTPLNVCLPSS